MFCCPNITKHAQAHASFGEKRWNYTEPYGSQIWLLRFFPKIWKNEHESPYDLSEHICDSLACHFGVERLAEMFCLENTLIMVFSKMYADIKRILLVIFARTHAEIEKINGKWSSYGLPFVHVFAIFRIIEELFNSTTAINTVPTHGNY